MFKTKKSKKIYKNEKEQKKIKMKNICKTYLEEASSIETFTDICATQGNQYK